MNNYAERFMRTIKEEEVDLQDFQDASSQIDYFIEDVYMTKRILSSLEYLTPSESELAYRLTLTQPVGGPPKNPYKSVQFLGSTH